MAFENSGIPAFTQAGSFSAEQSRRAWFATYARTSANSPGIISGGLLSSADLQLSNAVSGLVVNYSTGEAIVPGNEGGAQGGYYARNSSSGSLTLATASASNPRIDLVCLTVDDTGYTPPSGGTSGQVTAQAVTGTPTSGANVTPGSGGYLSGVGSLPASSLLLGYALVPTSATNLTSGDILNVATIAASQFTQTDTGWLTSGGLINSWANAGGGQSPWGYRRIGNQVRLRGSIIGGSSGSQFATLPSGFLPPYSTLYSASTNNALTAAAGVVEGSGQILIYFSGSPSYLAIDGTTFLTN
jgi:hypothetical protein